MIIAFLALLTAQEHQPDHGIPVAYHGVWDAHPSACNELVSDMRLGISSEKFSIYSDQFLIHQVTRKDDATLVVKVSFRSHDDFDNEGFGEPYDLVWKLSQSANELTMTSSKGATTWHRCSNQGNSE